MLCIYEYIIPEEHERGKIKYVLLYIDMSPRTLYKLERLLFMGLKATRVGSLCVSDT